MVGGRLSQKRVSVEVTGPKSILPEVVTQKVNFNLTFRDFLGRIVDERKLVGCKVTKFKGTWNKAVSLDTLIKDFIQFKFTRKMDCYRLRLMKPQKKKVSGRRTSDGEQVVYTLEDDDDGGVGPVEPAPRGAFLEVPADDGGAVVDGEQPCSSRSLLVQSPVGLPQLEAAQAPVTSATGDDGGTGVDGEQASSSRQSFSEQTARRRMPPPPAPHFKREMWRVADVKIEFDDAASTIGFLKQKGVAIDNLKDQVQERIAAFKNPFLIMLKEELVELRKSNGPQWQSLVGKAPRCVHLLGELFSTN